MRAQPQREITAGRFVSAQRLHSDHETRPQNKPLESGSFCRPCREHPNLPFSGKRVRSLHRHTTFIGEGRLRRRPVDTSIPFLASCVRLHLCSIPSIPFIPSMDCFAFLAPKWTSLATSLSPEASALMTTLSPTFRSLRVA